MCIINCHLPAGQKKVEARLIAIDDIHSKTKDNYDWMIFTGDTNFRVEMPYFSALSAIAKYREEQAEEAKLEILQTMQSNTHKVSNL